MPTAQPDPAAPPGGSARTHDEISLLEVLIGVLRSWRVVLLLPVVLAVGAGLLGLVERRTYTATASFVPQSASEGRSVSGAAALAQQFGISLGGDRAGQSTQFYVDLIRSGTILRRAVEAQYRLPREEGEWTGNLVQFWELEDRREPTREAVETLRKALSTTISRETSIARVSVSVEHPLLAEAIVGNLLFLLHALNLDVRQNRAREESRFIGERVAEVYEELLTAEGELQAFLQQNRDFRNSPDLTFRYERLQRQVALRQEVYGTLLRAQEEARIDGVRDTPMLTVIDSPEGTSGPSPRAIPLRMTIAFILGLLLALAAAFISALARRSRQVGDPEFLEFEELARAVWEDLRRPGRWLRRTRKNRVAPGG
jgi:uncharacterized protein involved in exopolysaccharide biosynthesis